MANMSYCRFQNTLHDLRDCADNMGDDDLSYDEAHARRRLIELAIRIAHDYECELEDPFPKRREYEAEREVADEED